MAQEHPIQLSRRGMFQVLLGRSPEESSEAGEKTASFWRDEGRQAFLAGDMDVAAGRLRQWLRQTPGDDESRVLYGRTLYAMGRHVQALVEFERVARRIEGHPAGLYLCLCRLRLGRAAKAQEAYAVWAAANEAQRDGLPGDLPAALADPDRTGETVQALERCLSAMDASPTAGNRA